MKNVLVLTYAAGAIAVLLLSEPLPGQVPPQTDQRPSVTEMLADFQVKVRSTEYMRGVPGPHRFIDDIVLRPQRWPVATVDSLLNRLEELALTSTHKGVQSMAILWIATMGEATRPSPKPRTLARLIRIYEGVDDDNRRVMLVQAIRLQADRAAAIEFLKRVVEEPRARGAYYTPPSVALYELTRMGQDGRAALRELHTRGKVRDPSTRHYLERLAAHDFREPEP